MKPQPMSQPIRTKQSNRFPKLESKTQIDYSFPELEKGCVRNVHPLADLGECFLKTEERGNQRKNERVQRWSNEMGPQPGRPEPAVYS